MFYILLVFVFCLHVCLSTACVPGVLQSKKGVSEPLTLELEVPVSCHVGAGNETQVLWKNSHCSETLSHLSSLDKIFCYR